jgi:hypothetical protein
VGLGGGLLGRLVAPHPAAGNAAVFDMR